MTRGALTLGDLRGRMAMLAVSCSKCGRSGRYRLAGLIDRHGADMSLPDLAALLSSDCPRRGGPLSDQCQVHFPDLVSRRTGSTAQDVVV